jgi:hypothetical protein
MRAPTDVARSTEERVSASPAVEPDGGESASVRPPESRIIRKRIAAKTTAIHISALASEPWAASLLERADSGGYLKKHVFPEQLQVRDRQGQSRMLSREEAWADADARAASLEWALLSGFAGQVAGFFSTHGQGVYANFGRPTMDFSGFFWDRVTASAAAGSRVRVPTPGLGGLQVGPLFIAADTAAASSLTALGHLARGSSLANPTVVSDVISTGAYEGTSAWATAKLGVFTGVKAMAVAGAVVLPGLPFAGLVAGFTVGAATAIAAKHVTNRLKDKAIDALYRPLGRRFLHPQRLRRA